MIYQNNDTAKKTRNSQKLPFKASMTSSSSVVGPVKLHLINIKYLKDVKSEKYAITNLSILLDNTNDCHVSVLHADSKCFPFLVEIARKF